MANLHQLLKAMVEKGASDLHVTTGSPPQLRIDGKLVPLKTPPLSPVDTKQLCYSILTDAQKHKFEEDSELDLSFGVKGLSRFRSNIFMQRGAVAGAFRTIPFKILTFQELGLPPIVADLARKPRGLVLVTGPTADMLSPLNSGWTITWQGKEGKIMRDPRPFTLQVARDRILPRPGEVQFASDQVAAVQQPRSGPEVHAGDDRLHPLVEAERSPRQRPGGS